MEGEQIVVKTEMFEGPAIVQFIHPGEMFPVQIELEHADLDGHRIKRVSWDEIINGEYAAEEIAMEEDRFTAADNGQLGFDF